MKITSMDNYDEVAVIVSTLFYKIKIGGTNEMLNNKYMDYIQYLLQSEWTNPHKKGTFFLRYSLFTGNNT